MSKAVTAGLLSALVAPGSGHLYLKHTLSGCVFLAIALLTLTSLLLPILAMAQDIAREVQSGGLDIAAITNEVSQRSADIAAKTAGNGYLFILCWFIALVDSIRLGRRQDKHTPT